MAAEAARFFNVWIVQSNMVYRGVPYSVVCDWIQEGRLTARDCVRTAEESNWRYIEDHELFKAYLEMPEATPRAEDEAEALADVDMDFSVKREEEGDEDPDMIPLIDISMVLLVFFMMTAQDLLTSSDIDSPKSPVAEITEQNASLFVNLKKDPINPSKILYSFGKETKAEMTDDEVVEKVQDAVTQRAGAAIVIIRADGGLPYEKVSAMVAKLQGKTPAGTRIQAQVKQQGGQQ